MSNPIVLTCEAAGCSLPAVKSVLIGALRFCIIPAAEIKIPFPLLRMDVCEAHLGGVRMNFEEIDPIAAGPDYSNVAAFN